MRVLVIVSLLLFAAASVAHAFTFDVFSSMLGIPTRHRRLSSSSSAPANLKENGGTGCLGCTLIVAILSQTMQVKNQNASQALATVCGYLPQPLGVVCDILGPSLGPSIYPLLDAKESPDAICNVLKMCTVETGVCRLFPAHSVSGVADGRPLTGPEFAARAETLRLEHPIPSSSFQSFNICTVVPGVCAFEKHMPFEDSDDDLFSTIPPLRGTNWRGKDCNDADGTVYPGRKGGDDRNADGNCNGIWGVDNATGASYESTFCANSGAMGVATLGDSASAHFRLPQDLVEAAKMGKETFAGVFDLIANEADFPMLAWATGHQPTSKYSPSVTGPMTSVYSLMNDLNKCNHRDFQNLGVNGADSKDLDNWVSLLARSNANDKPIVAFFAMIGNDVCGRTQDFAHMTTPQQYYDGVLKALRSADAKLPKGSHIVLVPLVDGRVLYNTMHDLIHPIGSLNKDVTYADFYDYLNCLVSSPCWGWMNSNQTVRDTTYGIAESLNAQLPKIVADTKGTLANVDVHYLGPIFEEVISAYTGPKSDLIEPVDGFHPSQTANALVGNKTFLTLQAMGIVPTVANPYNAAIERLFGDQGGY